MTRKLLAVPAFLLLAYVTPAQTPASPTPTSTSASMKVGGDVLPPKVFFSVKPKLQRSLFHAPKSGVVLVGLTVPPDGVPADLHIVHSGGAKLDDAALEAVSQYRFQPSTLNDKPVAVKINIEIKFKIY